MDIKKIVLPLHQLIIYQFLNISHMSAINFQKFMTCKGQFLSVTFKSEKQPASAFKGTKLEKIISGTFRAGINFANLSSVKEGIANQERGPVQELPWGEWLQFPYLIKHKDTTYVRLYPTANCKLHATYLVNGIEVNKETFMKHLTPSEQAKMLKGEQPECITVKANSLIALAG